MSNEAVMPTMNDQKYIDGKGPPFLPKAAGVYKMRLCSFVWRKGFRSQGFYATIRALESDHAMVKVGSLNTQMFPTGQTDQLQQQYRASELRQFHSATGGGDPKTLDLDARNREFVGLGESLEQAQLDFYMIVRLQRNKDGSIKMGKDGQPFTNVDFRAA